MENKNNKVEKEIVDTKVSKKVEDTEITMIDEFILDGVETEELEQESFVKAEIYAHIDSIRKDLNDPSKFQFKTAFIDEITGDDVVNTFKVSVELTKSTEETLKDLRKKYNLLLNKIKTFNDKIKEMNKIQNEKEPQEVKSLNNNFFK